MNPASVVLQGLWRSNIAYESSGGRIWNAFFEDDTDDILAVNGTPCGYTSAAWTAASIVEIASVSPTPIIFNGLVLGAYEQAMNTPSNSLGGMYDACYADATIRPRMWNPWWGETENAEIYQARHGKLFLCYTKDSTPASAAIAGRIYVYASFLLTYDPNTSVLWETYPTNSRFKVEPESVIVALDPVVPEPSDISSLRLSTGVYAREYRSCYFRSVLLGGCAAIVNPDLNASHSYPYAQYGNKFRHSLILSGGGIIDGGTAAANGPLPPSMLAPLTAVVAFQ